MLKYSCDAIVVCFIQTLTNSYDRVVRTGACARFGQSSHMMYELPVLHTRGRELAGGVASPGNC
jgi:hypothetical protein